MRVFFVSALVLVACASAQGEGLKEALREESFSCPPGTDRVGDPPPDGTVLFCEKTYQGAKPVKHGPYRSWYRTGEKKGEGYYQYGKPDGTFTQFYPSGIDKQKMTFIKGVQDGEQLRYFADGTLEIRRNFAKGKLNGKSETFYQNGHPKFDGQFLDGYPEGPVIAWYNNGQRKVQGFYHKQKKSGPWIAYYYDGTKKSEGSYSEGNLDGMWTEYREDGTAKTYAKYENGKVLKSYKGEQPIDPTSRHRKLHEDTLEALETRRFNSWDKTVQTHLKENRKAIASAGGEFTPIEQKAGATWQAKQDRKAHGEAYKAYWEKRRVDAQVENENTPLRGVFDVSEASRKAKRAAEAAQAE